MNSMLELTVTQLSAGYGPHAVLHDVSLAAVAGQIVGLIGENGAGKTTLLRAISGTIQRKARAVFSQGPKPRVRPSIARNAMAGATTIRS